MSTLVILDRSIKVSGCKIEDMEKANFNLVRQSVSMACGKMINLFQELLLILMAGIIKER